MLEWESSSGSTKRNGCCSLKFKLKKLKSFNVCVIGSSSSAFSVAITLAEKGINTVLLKRNADNAIKINFGETLCKSVSPKLFDIGMQDLFQNICMPTIENSSSTWGTANIEKKSNLLHPSGFGWIFERVKFEKALFDRLKETKAKVISGEIIRVTKKNERWVIDFDNVSISTDLIVIAVGRDKSSFIQLPRKISVDKLVCFIVSFKTPINNFDKSIYVDSSQNGWFYSIMNESGNRIINYFTDGDLLENNDVKLHIEYLKGKIKSLPSLSKVVAPSDLENINFYKIVSANTTFRTSNFKEGVLVCGDTAQTYDPLSSQGITNAVKDGINIGNAISNYYNGNQNSFIEYEVARRTNFAEYLKNRHRIYSKEVRWKSNPFWERRHNIENIKLFLKKVELY
jgi:flavin-dependent dehydrogenase